MCKFIQVTLDSDASRSMVNTRHIVAVVEKSHNSCYLVTTNTPTHTTLRNSFGEIKKQLEGADDV